ncbi:kinesin [Fusarium albosuccineum]|uniref:Kinesin n=1 Tax=Fusarium albosuccineum TaxID=1237068 RepID=A0A8H4LL97_9HYPO|nr:kinesin [Fusarium albosuccineum]
MEHGIHLYSSAQECLLLFQALLNHPNFVDDDWVEDRAADFKWWLHGLKVLKTGRSSLDYRLRDRTDIQKIIRDLLNGLSLTLQSHLRHDAESSDVERPCSQGDNAAQEDSSHSSVSEDSGSDSPWSEFSNGDSQPNDRQIITHSSASKGSDPRFYIRAYLGLLAKVSMAIRRSGTKLRYMKADDYLKTCSDNEEYTGLRKHLLFLILISPYEQKLFEELQRRALEKQIPRAVEIVVRSWVADPTRATAIQRRLIEANILRRNRINYAKHVSKNRFDPTKTYDFLEATSASEAPERPQEPVTKYAGSESGAEQQPLIQPVQPTSNQIESRESLTATKLDSDFVLPSTIGLEPTKKAVSVVTKMTQTAAHQDYPACPVSKGSFQCPYCVQVLTEDYTNKSRWRGHIAQDLSPYSCVYDDCANPQELYATKDEWTKHMANHHSSQRWVCDECTFRRDLDQEPIFDNEKDWKAHMSAFHQDELSDSQLSLLVSLRKRQFTNLARCPLCNRAAGLVRPDDAGHIADHLHAWALRALPYGPNTENNDSSDFMAVRGSDRSFSSFSSLSRVPEPLERDPRIREALKQELVCSRDKVSGLPRWLSSDIENSIDALIREMRQWISSAHPDVQNEIILQHLTTINQLLFLIPTQVTPSTSVIWPQRDIESSLRNNIRVALKSISDMSVETSHPSVNDSALSLLSLDGGGLWGLSTLYVLRRIMDRLNIQREIAGKPHQKPCQVFDLIGGTGTGGIIAIMLGRLEMDVDECIAAYSRLIEYIFGDIKDSGSRSLSLEECRSHFDSKRVANAVRRIIASSGCSPAEPFNGGVDRPCKVLGHNINYTSTIREVALATFDPLTFFAPINDVEPTISAYLVNNNPVEQVENKAISLWCPRNRKLQPLVKCFISIGPGRPADDSASILDDGLLAVLGKISAKAEYAANLFAERWSPVAERWSPSSDECHRYFRFNVEKGLETVGVNEHKQREVVEGATHRYLDSQAQRAWVRNCVENLMLSTRSTIEGRTRIPTLVDVLGKYALLPCHYIPLPHNQKFIGRTEVLEKLKSKLLERTDPARAALVGMGGMGKTQVALQFALWVRAIMPEHSVFWASARNSQDFYQSCHNIAASLDLLSRGETTGVELLVQECLSSTSTGSWVLILDNVNDVNQIRQISRKLPQSTGGFILFISRSMEVADLCAGNVVTLLPMTISAARAFLESSVNNKETLNDEDAIEELIRKLGCIPLVIAQAATHINLKHLPIASYLQLLDGKVMKINHFNAILPSDGQPNVEARLYYLSQALQLLRGSQEIVNDERFSLFYKVGQCLRRTERYEEAIECLRNAHAWAEWYLSQTHPERLAFQQALGAAYVSGGQAGEGFHLLEDVVKKRLRQGSTEDDPQLLESQYELARAYSSNGVPVKALELLQHVVTVVQQGASVGDEMRVVLVRQLGQTYLATGQFKNGIDLMERDPWLHESSLTKDHPDQLSANGILARLYRHNNQPDEAIRLLEGTIELYPKIMGLLNLPVIEANHVLAQSYSEVGETVKQLQELVDMSTTRLGPEDPKTADYKLHLSEVYFKVGRFGDAINLLELVIPKRREALAEGDPQLVRMEELLLACHRRQKARE